MTISWAASVLAARLQALTTAIDAGGAAGKVRFYNGVRPANGAAITTEILLLEELFPYPSYDSITGTVLALFNPVTAMVIADGTPTWGRIVTSANAHVLDGDVGLLASSAEFRFGNLTWYAGGSVIIDPSALTEL